MISNMMAPNIVRTSLKQLIRCKIGMSTTNANKSSIKVFSDLYTIERQGRCYDIQWLETRI